MHRVDIPFVEDGGAWRVAAAEPWWALVDLRNMLNLFHPHVVSQAGALAGATTSLTIPADWQPPFALRVFCADDYFADPEGHRPGQPGTESFFGHRFKQVLIGDRVVWERDVTDENTMGSQTVFDVDITKHVRSGVPFTLALRVVDKTSTTERNERDVWFTHPSGNDKTEEEPRFHTAVWFADVAVGERDAVTSAPPGRRPHEDAVSRRHRERWPLHPPGHPLPFPVDLELVAASDIAPPGFPITCGMPVPPGCLRDTDGVRLRGPNGDPVPVQAKPTGYWPDGSVRWFLLDAIAPPGTRAGDRFRLSLDGGGPAPQPVLTVRQQGTRVTLDTGAVVVDVGEDPSVLIEQIALPGVPGPVLSRVRPRMAVGAGDDSTPVRAARTLASACSPRAPTRGTE